jgi:hypothetical protein
MEIVIGWLVFSVLVGVYASKKGISPGSFFILSLVLSPLVGGVAALIASPRTDRVEGRQISDGSHKRCPMCAEMVRREAVKCRYCGSMLAKATDSPRPGHNIGIATGAAVKGIYEVKPNFSRSGKIVFAVVIGGALIFMAVTIFTLVVGAQS